MTCTCDSEQHLWNMHAQSVYIYFPFLIGIGAMHVKCHFMIKVEVRLMTIGHTASIHDIGYAELN